MVAKLLKHLLARDGCQFAGIAAIVTISLAAMPQSALSKADHRAKDIPASAIGRVYATHHDIGVRVYRSARYRNRPELNGQWANFFAGLLHGNELKTLTVYIAPLSEIRRSCQAQSDGCYKLNSKVLMIPADQPAQGDSLQDIATHEYGHHLANSRANPPWSAARWGPKRWASAAHICRRVKQKTAFPGDQGLDYELDPAEAFAESYLVANGGQWGGIVDQSFYPTSTMLAALRADVRHPWTRNEISHFGGKLKKGGATFNKIVSSYDGLLQIRVRISKGMQARIVLRGNKKTLAKGTVTSNKAWNFKHTVCGFRHFEIGVYGRRGRGRYRIEISKP